MNAKLITFIKIKKLKVLVFCLFFIILPQITLFH